jgi:hypothetical protein
MRSITARNYWVVKRLRRWTHAVNICLDSISKKVVLDFLWLLPLVAIWNAVDKEIDGFILGAGCRLQIAGRCHQNSQEIFSSRPPFWHSMTRVWHLSNHLAPPLHRRLTSDGVDSHMVSQMVQQKLMWWVVWRNIVIEVKRSYKNHNNTTSMQIWGRIWEGLFYVCFLLSNDSWPSDVHDINKSRMHVTQRESFRTYQSRVTQRV